MHGVSRYLAPAAAIVFAFIAMCLAIGRLNEAVHARYPAGASPGPSPTRNLASSSPLPVEGDAPWALSALPECFRQVRSVSGPAAVVAAERARILDARAQRVTGRLAVADCTVAIEPDRAFVVRGDNRLVVPPQATFYVKGPLLILDRVAREREELRVYEPAPGAAWTLQVHLGPGGVDAR